MKAKILLISMAYAITANLHVAKAQAVNVNDSLALVDFYNSTNGPNWHNHRNWLTGPVSTWYGVLTAKNRVVQIAMEQNNITGPLPFSFGNLTALSHLYLRINNLSGTLPESIGSLSALDYLNLGFNNFTGELPASIGNLSNLVTLNFYGNKLTGPIPAAIGNLANLQILDLGSNYFQGNIPSSIGKLTKLTFLYLTSNNLTGSIPESIGNMKMLQTISIVFNHLTGPIPSTIGKLSNLVELWLYSNHLSGPLPYSLGNCTLLQEMHLYDNNFTGNLPSSLLRLKQLKLLDLGKNHLSAKQEVPIDTTITTTSVYLFQNNYTFTGLESMSKSIKLFSCRDQAPIKIHQHNGVLAVSPGGTLSKLTCYWQKVGSPAPYLVITGDTTFHPTESGKYWVKINDSKVPGLVLKTDTVNYVVPAVQMADAGKIAIYPNPVQSALTITGLDAKSKSTIVVSDYVGTVWFSAVGDRQAAAKYNVSKLKPGNYVVTITNGKAISTLKFMKQ